MTHEQQIIERPGPNLRIFAVFLALAALAVLIASGLRAAHAEEAVGAVTVEGTTLRLALADGRVLAGADLVGVTLTIGDGAGNRLPVRVDAVKPDPLDPSGETMLYAFSVEGTSGQWRSLCQADPYGGQWALPLAFGEDGTPTPAGVFSITCTSGARGKCIRFGYKPWHADVAGVSMRGLYDACVHMVRADYCGDGTAHTRDGTLIDIYDRAGIQQSEPEAGMSFEAAWGPQGAVCLARTRLPDVATMEAVLESCPRLRQAPTGADCTETAVPGALLFNRSY